MMTEFSGDVVLPSLRVLCLMCLVSGGASLRASVSQGLPTISLAHLLPPGAAIPMPPPCHILRLFAVRAPRARC